MKNNKNILRITQTALLTALLIGWQAATAPLNNQILTGSGVNAILIISVMATSLPTGLCVGIISQVMAFFFGIGPKFPALIPFIILGNISIILTWHFIGNFKPREIFRLIAVPVAAGIKTLVLYLGVVKLAIPLLVPQAPPLIAEMFSFPQFVTATIGGAFALAILPALKKAVKSNSQS